MTALDKLNRRIDAVGSLLCVGLDADIDRVPAAFSNRDAPQYAFNRWLIDETHPYVCAYKPNIAFYEARGADGWRELADTMAYLRERHPDVFTICDAKRADIGNTNRGYVRAVFDELGFDAITLHPYLGGGALAPFLERDDKVSVILCRTSNPGAPELQALMVAGRPLWEQVAVRVRDEWNANGNCMLVVGATSPDDLGRAREIAPEIPFLVPGVGAQGGDPAAVVAAGADANGRGLVVNAARSVIFADNPAGAAAFLRAALRVS
jgi:orotidine-5'-phosphate decarboxylase